MNTRLKMELIKEAQRNLVNNPRNYAHEVTHPYRVWLYSKDILNNVILKDKNIDIDLLEVLCWWHDVKILDFKYKEGERIVQGTARYLCDNYFKGTEKAIIEDGIIHHEFEKKPKYLEGKILQDADKLELLDEERLRIGYESVVAGYHEKERAISILSDILDSWLLKENVDVLFNFDYAKKIYLKELSGTRKRFQNTIGMIKNLS